MLETPLGRYRWHDNWVNVPGRTNTGARTHGVVVTRRGEILIFHQGNPAMLVYSQNGQLLSAWGDYLGAHGLTLVVENDEEFLWLVDDTTGNVHKTTLDGHIVQRLAAPVHAAYIAGRKFSPIQVAINESSCLKILRATALEVAGVLKGNVPDFHFDKVPEKGERA